jgi:cell division protein FtsB
MRNFREKSKWRAVAQSKPFLLFLGIVILVFAWNVFGLWRKMRTTVSNANLAAARVAELESQKAKLTEEIDTLNTTEGKEKIFRENYGLAKEGEDVIVVVPEKNSQDDGEGKKSPFSFLFFWKNWGKK